MNSIEKFKDALLKESISYVYRKYLLGHEVWFFREKLSLDNHAVIYEDLKIYMSEQLGIHVNNIAIVGSAKLGFSLTPTDSKLFSEFSEDSDIDIVVVSPELFKKSWSAFLELNQKGYLPSYAAVAKNIFKHFVSLKDIDPRSDFLREWTGKIEPCKKDLQTLFSIPHDINYRIYDSWEDVERYHTLGLNCIKEKIENETK
ncbi:hypothetical protein RSF60_000724 [Yersinia enterocolitica]|uniref:hypothetical protein n=1 Tax=Yersinia enterocolitica TaxID=630 RepID=UPI0028B432A0|nr:hypothetical protein [Yersinia enterocolitica]